MLNSFVKGNKLIIGVKISLAVGVSSSSGSFTPGSSPKSILPLFPVSDPELLLMVISILTSAPAQADPGDSISNNVGDSLSSDIAEVTSAGETSLNGKPL